MVCQMFLAMAREWFVAAWRKRDVALHMRLTFLLACELNEAKSISYSIFTYKQLQYLMQAIHACATEEMSSQGP